MTQDEIIKMAKEAGMDVFKSGFCYMDDFDIYKFAKLVAQHEREACAMVCEDYGRAEEMQAIGNDYANAIRAKGQA